MKRNVGQQANFFANRAFTSLWVWALGEWVNALPPPSSAHQSSLSASPLSSSACGASISTGSAGSTVTFVPVCWMNCWRLTCLSSFVSCSSSCSLSCQERENICWAAASIKQHFKILFATGQLVLLLLKRQAPIFKCKWKSWNQHSVLPIYLTLPEKNFGTADVSKRR